MADKEEEGTWGLPASSDHLSDEGMTKQEDAPEGEATGTSGKPDRTQPAEIDTVKIGSGAPAEDSKETEKGEIWGIPDVKDGGDDSIGMVDQPNMQDDSATDKTKETADESTGEQPQDTQNGEATVEQTGGQEEITDNTGDGIAQDTSGVTEATKVEGQETGPPEVEEGEVDPTQSASVGETKDDQDESETKEGEEREPKEAGTTDAVADEDQEAPQEAAEDETVDAAQKSSVEETKAEYEESEREITEDKEQEDKEKTPKEGADEEGKEQEPEDGKDQSDVKEERTVSPKEKQEGATDDDQKTASDLQIESQDVSSSLKETGRSDKENIPEAPRIPSAELTGTSLGGGSMSSSALNIVWSFGLNRSVPVLNLTDGVRKVIMYACAHVGVLYDFHNNRQHILQGHSNPITCICVSEDKRWLVTGDKGPDAMVIFWDTYTGIPIQTLFDSSPDGGVVAISLSPDARYLATLSAQKQQTLSIWDWTIDGETPICTALLNPSYGVQHYVTFNAEDIHYLISNSESQCIFYHWEDRSMEYYTPPLTDEDFNKPVGRYSQSIFIERKSRALTATSIGNLVVWDNHKPLTKRGMVQEVEIADKRALKIVRLQDRGINVLTRTDNYIVAGDVEGQVKFYDQRLKLIYSYQELHLGPVTAVSFAFNPDFQPIVRENTNFPPDATIAAKEFIVRDFVVGSSIAVFGNVTVDNSKVEIIHREHDASVHALAAHPTKPIIVIGSYSGLLKAWDYEKKEVVVSRILDRGNLIRCCTFDPKGIILAVGFTNGVIRIVDSITFLDELDEPFHYARDAITQIIFSHDNNYMAAADAEYTMTVFKRLSINKPFICLGRYRAHYRPIKDILFGVHLDSDAPRLVSLGEDRVMVEYDLEGSGEDGLKIGSSDRIEQSAVPMCMAWYPPVTKENFIVTANDQFKFKLFNATTKMCRKTLLGPTYGSPIQKLAMIPAPGGKCCRYMAYATEDKVGMHILPLDGNPHNSMALIAHPNGVSNLACSYDGNYIFTAGGSDATVHMWEINTKALEAQSRLGGEDLIPFYGLLDGGREGELFAELEDYFYYAQIRTQGINTMSTRQVSIKIQLSEVPFVMRAMGFYPSEQEIEDMVNEVKFSEYVETGQYVDSIDLGDFIKLYVNHRPAFGLSTDCIGQAFETLGVPDDDGVPAIERGELLDILQSKGEHMTEYELAEYLTTLLGFNPEGGSSELQDFDADKAAEKIDEGLPGTISAETFSDSILGFSMYGQLSSTDQKIERMEN